MYISFLSLFLNGSTTTFIEEIPAPTQDPGLIQTLVMVGIAILFFYLILWRPEQKRRQTILSMQEGVKKGDTVVVSNIIGVIQHVEDKFVIVQMVDGSKIKFLKSAVQEILEDTTKEEKPS